MSKKKYVVNLGLSYDKFSEEVLEDILTKANMFIEERIASCIVGKNFEVNSSILAVKDETITFEVLLEVISPIPLPLEYEIALDRIVDDTFKLIENALREVGSNATA
ncbi:MAG: hypothetical protein QXV34_00625 [Sulfolobales archaeon]